VLSSRSALELSPEMPFSDSEMAVGVVAVAPAGGVAPVDSPESFWARPSRSSAHDGPNAPFYYPTDYRDWLDYTIVEDGRRDVSRLYEDRHSRPDLRWFWSITIYFAPKLGITTNGREASLNEAKEQFLRNWPKCRTASIPAPRPSTY
jgi:hypothetical protein